MQISFSPTLLSFTHILRVELDIKMDILSVAKSTSCAVVLAHTDRQDEFIITEVIENE